MVLVKPFELQSSIGKRKRQFTQTRAKNWRYGAKIPMVLENVWAFVDLSRQCYYSTCNVRPRTLDKLIEWLNATGKTKQIWILGSWSSLRRRHYLPYWTTHNGIKKRIAHSTVSTHIITSPMIEGGGMQGMLMWHDKWKSGQNTSLDWRTRTPFALTRKTWA